jgi:heme oxygenase (biliverdin-IX-beta and delta-forming)
MLVRIGLDTRAHHATADADRLKVLDVAGPAQYASYLARVHGYEAPVEAAVAALPDMLVHLTRPKAGQLRRDLLALGLTDPDLAALPRCGSIGAMSSRAQALGWLYVLERNTLITGLLRRHLTHRMPAEMKAASAYLSASSVAPGARLRALGEALAVEAEHGPHAIAEIVAAANEAFRCQRHWLRSWTPTSRLGSRGERPTGDSMPPIASSDREDSAAS